MFLRCVCCLSVFKQSSRSIFSSNTRFRNHYDVLGITPKATQTDIKSAFYKLSKMYHPDKNKGSDDASRKFQDISSAYEVLGNFKLRRLYDKGILHTAGHQYAQEDVVVEEHPEHKFYQSRRDRRAAPSMSGKTPIYDFDEWSKAHYGATFERGFRARAKAEEKRMRQENNQFDIKNETAIMGLLTFFVLLMFFTYTKEEPYDMDVVKHNKKE